MLGGFGSIIMDTGTDKEVPILLNEDTLVVHWMDNEGTIKTGTLNWIQINWWRGPLLADTYITVRQELERLRDREDTDESG